MVYNIDFSFDSRQVNLTLIQNNLLDIASKYDVHNYYFSFEENLKKNNLKIMCIFHLVFSESEIKNMIRCTNEIRNISKIYLDCIYEENQCFRLIYASKYYLSSIEKDSVSNYKKFHRERSYSENDYNILHAIQVIKQNINRTVSQNDLNANMSYDEYLKRLG